MSSEHDHIGRLLDNPLFREWVLNPTPELDRYWLLHLQKSPEDREILETGRQFLLQLKQEVEFDFPDDNKVREMYSIIDEHTDTIERNFFQRNPSLMWVAASIVIGFIAWLGGISGWLEPTSSRYEELVQSAETPLKEYINNTPEPLVIKLPDSSSISLNPGSRLSHAVSLPTGSLREVYLEGSAFFDIHPDPEKPFHVYSDELVTKVLGTSFWIHDCPEKDELIVKVMEGKVSVSTLENYRSGNASPFGQELFLTPNQQVLFGKKNTSFKKALVPNPVMLKKHKQENGFEFDDVPASVIFESIENAYGVTISYDKDKTGHCLLTASLTDETLFEILDLLCTALGARYFVEDTKIIITGNGCST